MLSFPPTLILRHRKENLKKCSLSGLENRKDLRFFTYPIDIMPDLSGYVLLTPDAPSLTLEDKTAGIFLIDGTWRYAKVMFEQLPQPHHFTYRSLSKEFVTAYPRRQEKEHGLASVEALFLAYWILGRETEGLLDHYYWKDLFLSKNLAFR